MQQYSDTIQDRQGNVIGAATVTVTNYPSGTTATTYATNAIGSSTNPITADNNGQYSFYAVDGSYTVTTSKSGITTSSKVITLSDTSIFVSVKGYGAAGDGTTDDTTAIQAALTAGAGGAVLVPEGNYKITGTITIPPSTTLKGVGACDVLIPLAGGSNFSITNTSGTSFLMGRGSTIDGCNFWYPNQVTTSPPTAYDYTITVDNTDSFQSGNNAGINIQNIVIHNAYKGIDLGGSTAVPNVYGVAHLENIRMYALHTGIRSGYTLSEVFLANSEFSPVMWTASNGTASRQWAMTSGNACLHIVSQQGLQMSNVVMYGHARGIYTQGASNTTFGNVTFMQSSGCTFDGLRTCVEIAGNNGFGGATFTGCIFAATDAYNAGFLTGKCFYLNDSQNANTISLTGCSWSPTTGNHLHIEMPTSVAVQMINVDGGQFLSCGTGTVAGAYYNVYCDSTTTKLSLNGSQFQNLAANASIVNVKVLNAAQLSMVGLHIHDTAKKAFEIGTVTISPIIRGILTRSTVGSSWPTATSFVVASAATITLFESDIDYYEVSGTTNITSVTASWPGRKVTLKFSGVLTFTDGSNLKLAGDFVTTADDTITLVCNGTNWYEVSRSVN